MRAERVSLVGFMGSGKTTLGARIAARLRCPFVDLDERIMECAGKDIPAIFSSESEEGFRRRERQALEEALGDGACVLACGGGAASSEDNRRLLRERSLVVWLDATLETARARIEEAGEATRPLVERLGWEGMRRLHRQRRRDYACVAHYRFDSGRENAASLVRQIVQAIRREREEEA